MQLRRHQWKLGSILLGGSARPSKDSLWRALHPCQTFPRLYASYHASSRTQHKSSHDDDDDDFGVPLGSERLVKSNLPFRIRKEAWGSRRKGEAWVTPQNALGQYLRLRTPSERADYWISIKNVTRRTELPAVLVQFMHGVDAGYPESTILGDECKKKLKNLHFDLDDVAHWAWIMSPSNPDEIAQRFVSSTRDLPMFLLFQVLRGEIQKVRTLKSLFVHVWDNLMGITRLESKNSSVSGGINSKPPQHRLTFQKHSLDEGGFNLLISLLLYHTRRLWPSAMLTVSKLIQLYLMSFMKKLPDQTKMDPKSHARLCNMNNRFLRIFSLPASLEPYKSMAHNWAAQRVLLQLAGQFQPPLTVDKRSYEAVISVLTALKKSDREAKVASLRARSWPPWRVDQDGIDAERSPEDDQSRATSAIIKSKEAGYSANLYDQTMSIFAGQEPDGTPTIHTRKLFKVRNADRSPPPQPNELNHLIWAARIKSTRDVGEAWSAFIRFQEIGGRPTQNVYLAMFEKIEFETKRLARPDCFTPSPGDGKEVLPVSDDNFSDFYKQTLQPPELSQLYQQMLKNGFPPKGRCLNFLVRHARTIDEGFSYLIDGGMDKSTMEYLLGDPSSEEIPAFVHEKVPLPIFADIIYLLCRFAPRAIPVDESDPPDGPLEDDRLIKLDSQARKWIVRKIDLHLPYRSHMINPLHQAAYLLNQRQPFYRPAWYHLFQRLASRHVLISPNWDEFPSNNQNTWQVLVAALNEFHACGLELDPYGFLLVCTAFEKYARNHFGSSDQKTSDIREASQIVKAEFRKLIETVEDSDILPLFMHSTHGAQLHNYVRCMGLIGDHDEILVVLRWMVLYHEELQKVSARSKNGLRLLRHTLVAIRVFTDGTDHGIEAQELMENVDTWEGWPSDNEMQIYTGRDLKSGQKEEENEDKDAPISSDESKLKEGEAVCAA